MKQKLKHLFIRGLTSSIKRNIGEIKHLSDETMNAVRKLVKEDSDEVKVIHILSDENNKFYVTLFHEQEWKDSVEKLCETSAGIAQHQREGGVFEAFIQLAQETEVDSAKLINV